ncbi:MAG: hypothetical protein GYB68_17555, partial [Chloroflexi bacterium]|nr:hypothetical protein [Chloroflexota bacterium]
VLGVAVVGGLGFVVMRARRNRPVPADPDADHVDGPPTVPHDSSQMDTAMPVDTTELDRSQLPPSDTGENPAADDDGWVAS